MSGRLSGQVAVVTGAGRGIGRAIALALSEEGAFLSLAARTKKEIDAAAQEIEARGGRALSLVTDVSQESQVEELINSTLAAYGKIDVLVNCAGIGRFGPVANTSLADWQAQLDVNLTGAFLCCRAALKPMIEQRRGHIINISSGAGRVGFAHAAAYCASKFGLMGLSEALALELKEHNIKVSVVCPGRTDTSFAGLVRTSEEKERILKPEDVAKTVLDVATSSERALISELHVRPFKWV